MDSVLEDCKNKVADAVFETDSSAHPGNVNATPELLLTLIEKTREFSSDFATAFTKHTVSGDLSGELQADAIKKASGLSQAIYQLADNVKGATSLLSDDVEIERVLNLSKTIA